MTQYEPKVIYKFAADLYNRARFLVFVYTMAGVVIGGGLGKAYATSIAIASAPSAAVLGSLLGNSAAAPTPSPGWTILGALMLGLLGFWTGSSKAFVLKLQAQIALCQVRIEENTNRPPVQA